MSPIPETAQSKKRESRAGTRRVTALSAEQLERKRANDREAQRTIRQRTKEHIERLELQVAELKTKGERFDEVVRQNAALESEIRALRHQLVMASSGAGYHNLDETYAQQHSATLIPSPQYSEVVGATPASRAPSVLSSTSQVSVTRDWQTYSSTRSSSRCDSSDTEYPARVEPWVFDGPPQASMPTMIPQPHVGFPHAGGNLPNPSFQQTYSQSYHAAVTNRDHENQVPSNQQQQPGPYGSSQRNMSVPAGQQTAGYPPVHATQPYHQSIGQQPKNNFGYDWVHRS